MRIKKAYLASLGAIPTAFVPLAATANCSCSQSWGNKTPISIGTNIYNSKLNPFYNFIDNTALTDLNGQNIVPQLQTNYAIDVAKNNFYGYSLPEKWNSDKDNQTDPGVITWDKGAFDDGEAGWHDYSSAAFVKSADRSGKRASDQANVSETVYSYRNNTLSSNIQLVGLIGQAINSYINYAFQYQGTQIGTEFGAPSETDTDLAVSWGGSLTHGSKNEKPNREFFESIFASNAIAGTGKSQAVLHPTHVEFTFDNFPIVAYATNGGKVQQVSPVTLELLNGTATRPSASSVRYWESKSDEVTEKIHDIRKNKEYTYKYIVYQYTNVPVLVSFNAWNKTYVNPTINNNYRVDDYYSSSQSVRDTIGGSWYNALSKFAQYKDLGEPSVLEAPKYCSFTFTPVTAKTVDPLASGDKHDRRLDATPIKGNSFIVLMNYAYKEYTEAPSEITTDLKTLDRVTMTGIKTIFPAYLLDSELKLGDESTFFYPITQEAGVNTGYAIDADKVNRYNNLFFELVKRSSGQGLVTEAKSLNETSKKLLKLLAYLFGNSSLNVNTSEILTTKNLEK